MSMNLLKIICLCIIGTSAFSMGEDASKEDRNDVQKITTPAVWVGNQQIDAVITKNFEKLVTFANQNPHVKSTIEKVSPYFSDLHMLTETADQKLFLTFVAGSVLSQNDYLYFITLPATAYYAERSLKSVADAWCTSDEEKKSFITVRGISLNAREFFVVAGLSAMLIKRNIYSSTFLVGAYTFAHLTRDNKEKRFDAGSFLAYMILLNALNSLNI